MSVHEPVVSFLQIVLINVLLSGDNALVIAMAAGRLPARLRRKAIRWGVAGAVVLRIALALAPVWLLPLPLLQAGGALLLSALPLRLASDRAPPHQSQNAASLRSPRFFYTS